MTEISTSTQTGVRKEISKGRLSLDKLSKGEFQKPGTLTAQIRQTITTRSFYPSKKTASNMQGNIFDNVEFGFSEQEFESIENRMAFLLVPESVTEEQVRARLAKAEETGACIYRVLSNQPILDDNQKYAVSVGLRTLDQFADKQVVRYPETEDNIAKGIAGSIWLDTKGQVQYRKTFFWNTPILDQTSIGKGEPYMTPSIKAELEGASVLSGQRLIEA